MTRELKELQTQERERQEFELNAARERQKAVTDLEHGVSPFISQINITHSCFLWVRDTGKRYPPPPPKKCRLGVTVKVN